MSYPLQFKMLSTANLNVRYDSRTLGGVAYKWLRTNNWVLSC